MNPQSPLAPRGPDAAQVAELVWTLLAGGGVIVVVMGLLIVLALRRAGGHAPRYERAWLLGGGIAFPVVVLAALIPYAIAVGNSATRCDGPDVTRVSITGEMWWWRITYAGAGGGGRVETANELVLPAGRRVELSLHTADVIHGLWIPGLAGMKDLIPGRLNQICTTTGAPAQLRGQCTEFCGLQHANMALDVNVVDPDAFGRWLERQASIAPAPLTADGQRGAALFVAHCGSCHAIRGTAAGGASGPDLTHVGSRASIAAGTLPNNPGTLAAWISASQHVKPGNRMPDFPLLAGDELSALAAYLSELR